MPRTPRLAPGGCFFHVLNRGNARRQLFFTPACYARFVTILQEAAELHDMRVLAYCIMPNHWHLLVWPRRDGDLARFVQWLSAKHTRLWHLEHDSVGTGHLYQARYKSFVVRDDNSLLRLIAYIERNPLRAGLVALAQDWPWSSLQWRVGLLRDAPTLVVEEWVTMSPRDWLAFVNTPQPAEELAAVRDSIATGRPYGDRVWQMEAAARLRLPMVVRGRGRPRKVAG